MTYCAAETPGQGIDKMPTGIEGFDAITGGGLPCNRTTLILGAAGTGKTVFALQTLVNGARLYGEPGIFVAIEEKARQVIANAATFGWDLPSLENNKLFFLDARISPEVVSTGGFDLVGLLAGLKAKAAELGARRIVFDSIDVLLSLLGDENAERQEVYRLHDWLSSSGLTGILTSGTQGLDPLSSQHYGFMQFMADSVVLLDHRLLERVSLREVRVVKYRGSAFAENEFPMVIGPSGIEIATLGAPGTGFRATKERISTGIERLDTMLKGGYFRGSSTLITGSPGTAKSTLSSAFADAACRRGERTLYVSFDEGDDEIIRNLDSVNIHLEPHVKSGILRIYPSRSESRSAEEHLIQLRRLILEHEARCVVIDPISAMLKAGGRMNAVAVAQRLLYMTKSSGITLVATSLLEDPDPQHEATDLNISTVADTWLHLSYVIQGGERNRALTIIKARGTGHSNQVRELVLSDEGITLADVYTAGGAVLMGTLRWEHEQAEAAAKEKSRLDRDRERREAEQAQSELKSRIDAMQHEYDTRQTEMESLAGEEDAANDQRAGDLIERGRRRGLDDAPGGGDGAEGGAR